MNIDYIATLFADCCSPACLELVLPTVPLGAWWESNRPRPDMLWCADAEGQVADMMAIGAKLGAEPVVVATHVSKSIVLPVVVYDMGHSSVSCWGNFYRDFVALSGQPGDMARLTARPSFEAAVDACGSTWRVSAEPGVGIVAEEIERHGEDHEGVPSQVWRAAAAVARQIAERLEAKAEGGAP